MIHEKMINEAFQIKQEFRQGDPLSTTLFNLIMEVAMKNSGLKMKETIFSNENQFIAFKIIKLMAKDSIETDYIKTDR